MLRAACNYSALILAPRIRQIATQTPRLQTVNTEDDKTIAKVLNQEVDAGLMVDGFSNVGFRLNNGMQVVGPVAIFAKSVLSWRVKYAEDITEDSLSLFCLLEPKIDLLIIGVGDRGSQLHPRVRQYMRHKGINVEVLPTESACTTFNFLNGERRYVAAALIPPYKLLPTEEDLVKAQTEKQEIFETKETHDFY